jgi:Fur family ferric uptake transcriptional regulator
VTVTHDSTPLGTSTLDATFDHLRDSGVRLTAARRLVIEALFATDRPISAEEIASGLGGRLPGSDVASVYRNLETLQRLGLVRHMHLGHNAGRYRLADGGERAYVACERCGAFDGMAPEVLDRVRAAVAEATGFEARFTHFPVVGLCPRCAERTSTVR